MNQLIIENAPPHPGQFIKEVYIHPFNLVPNQVAKNLKINPSTFTRLLNKNSDVSPEMAIRLSIVFGRSPESWLLMQNNYNLKKVRYSFDVTNIQPLIIIQEG